MQKRFTIIGLKEIAKAFGLTHYAAIANAIFTLSNKLAEYSEINLKLNTIIKRLAP
ncbi:protein of unknown function [Legionella fallonii LLAP-10]|uniref:Uncharacterized protein n=1 Tax=Legionella fallonii LLAP-10 TaxID=1212491 RepID=A0A098G6D8_9GAMM|nr:protein of unknown function [Legionella fallonii LLAP-10]